MTPMDMTMIVKYKVSSFLYLYNDFWYNSLGSIPKVLSMSLRHAPTWARIPRVNIRPMTMT